MLASCTRFSRNTQVTCTLNRRRQFELANHYVAQTRLQHAPAEDVTKRKRPREVHQSTSTPRAADPPPIFNSTNKSPSSYAMQLASLVQPRNMVNAFSVVAHMKKHDIKPNAVIYSFLLDHLAREHMYVEARAVMDDMRAMNVDIERSAWHALLQSTASEASLEMWRVVAEMEAAGIERSAQTYSFLIRRYLQSRDLEITLRLTTMALAHIPPVLEVDTAQEVIKLTAHMGHPRLALDLAERFELNSYRRFDLDVWMTLLISSAEYVYGPGVERAWSKVVIDFGSTPDEGTCVSILTSVERFGNHALGLSVLRTLKAMGVVWKEHHLSPIVGAFAKSGDLREAFETVGMIRSGSVIHGAGLTLLNSRTLNPILQSLVDGGVGGIDRVWPVLDKMHAEGKNIDVTIGNVIILACVALNDLQRAMSAYQSFDQYGIKPDVDTFNALLSVCVARSQLALGKKIVAEMKQLEINPDRVTYERLVLLSLTQSIYEDAFDYLEEMKRRKLLPPVSVYEAIVRKCFSLGDSRWRMAINELKEAGYQLSQQLVSDLRL